MIMSLKKQSICSAESAAAVIQAILNAGETHDLGKEHFYAIGLNTKNIVQYIELISLGSLNACIVHPREVFRFACIKGIAALIIAHNHPSGDTAPNQEDILLTKRLTQAGEVLGIKVLDHVIVGEEKTFFSFRDKGLISP
jgi:DNA repair protein RadC